MNKIKGFRIRHKLVKLINWATRRKKSNYKPLNPPNSSVKAMSELCKFGRTLKELCSSRPGGSNYVRVGQENPVPKGHLAVYVGEKEDDAHRILVPVIYFNHPLFGALLKESEKVYGFNYSGGVHVPCRISEFENVQTRIIAGGCGVRGRARRSWRLTL